MNELIESILLQAEILDLKANAKCPAQGSVIESQMETGRGPTATVIVQKGTLKAGDSFVCGETWCKVRALMDDCGNRLPSAAPGTPALILGWDAVPSPGAKFRVVKNDREARELAEESALAARKEAEAQQQAPNTGARPGMSDLERLMAALAQDKEKSCASCSRPTSMARWKPSKAASRNQVDQGPPRDRRWLRRPRHPGRRRPRRGRPGLHRCLRHQAGERGAAPP
ncbi:translation initiation factor IF-2 [Verrucomicrobiota bacterium]|nr:translation initiation factor IF-2 [Verrucomicrobiota bacterium]